MSNPIKQTIKRLLGKQLSSHLLYRRYYRRALERAGFPMGKAAGEEAYKAKWRQLSRWVEPYSYRLFSHYCGPTPDIIPEDIMHNIVEATLNPRHLWDVYEDKNMFPLLLDADVVPRTVARRVGGGPIDYATSLAGLQVPLILKPSIASSCGEHILRFDRVGDNYVSNTGLPLDEAMLTAYGSDWVLQEAIVQHPLMAQFCSTSVNTMRLVVYRSVVDLQPHLTCGIFRMGNEGSVVDNAVAGGLYVGIDVEHGRLRGDAFDITGYHKPFAGCDLPCWDKVVDLACYVASRIPHHHLLALDIAVAANEKPMLLEYNIGGFSSCVYNYTGQTVFGQYTDEVIRWVLARR